VAFATYFIIGERLVARNDAVAVTFWGFAVSAAMWTILGGIAVVTAWWQPDLTAVVALPENVGGSNVPMWWLFLWIVALGTVIPFGVETAAMRYMPATTVSVLATAEPMGSAVVAWWAFGETLTGIQILGGTVVIAGIVLALLSRTGDEGSPLLEP
jgi:drug/metabolite transporter (DMT)-like permease